MIAALSTIATVVMVATVVGLGELAASVLCFYLDRNILGTALLVLNPLCLVAVPFILLYH